MYRLTYKTIFGDYGSNRGYKDEYEEIQMLRNALGKYEDLGYTSDELQKIIKKCEGRDENKN